MNNFFRRFFCLFAAGSAVALCAHAQVNQPNSSADKDELIFSDGERLIGKLERSSGTSVTFKSDMAGEITVDWSKIKELHTSQDFAVQKQGVTFGRHEDTSKVPQGAVSMADQTLQLTRPGGAPPQTIPVPQVENLIDLPTFEKALQRPGLLQDWKGSASFGASLVLATQNNRSYTSAVSLARAIPTETWMEPENRTTIDFNSAYGQLTQPGQPMVKTSIFHADAERDEYFTRRLYMFAAAAFDHNYSQGLDLQQTFGGGLGWTVVKGKTEEFDLKAQLNYEKQQFSASTTNQELIASQFSERYNRLFNHGLTFHEELSVLPAWNNLSAYSATGDVSLAIAVFKRLSVSLGSLDTFLNNPSPGFKKNSFQFTTSLTYTLK